jgi:prenyltransferase beta subunit
VSAPNQNETIMDCAEFQQKLPELFEEHADLSHEEHLKHCENCSALVRDLEYIAQQAKLLLPIHEPSPAVWDTIQSALQREQAEAENHDASGSTPPVR